MSGPEENGTYDLGVVRRRAEDRAAEHEEARTNDNGLRTVLVRDPQIEQTERGWHVYGPFERTQAVMVADDLRTALWSAGMFEITVELVGWQPWDGL